MDDGTRRATIAIVAILVLVFFAALWFSRSSSGGPGSADRQDKVTRMTIESRYIYNLRVGAKPVHLIEIEMPEGGELTEQGRASLEAFVRSEEQVFPALRERIYQYYADVWRTVRHVLPSPDPIMDQIMPEIRIGNEIDELVTLHAIEAAPDGKRILLMYETEWDVEHGLNVIVADQQIEEIGLGVDVFLD